MPVTDKDKLLAKILARGGSGKDEDLEAVRAQVQGLPIGVLELLRKKKVKIVACRGSVTDVDKSLKGKIPRGWEGIGRTWDTVPGAYLMGKKKVAIATVAGPGGKRVVPERGPTTHGSFALAIHETMHGHDIAGGKPLTHSAAFRTARDSDLPRLPAYEGQAGEAGLEETYAESAARHFGGDPAVATDWPALTAWWETDPAGSAISGDSLSGDSAADGGGYEEDGHVGTATLATGGAIHLDLKAYEPGVAVGHAAFALHPDDEAYDLVRDHVSACQDGASDLSGPTLIAAFGCSPAKAEQEPSAPNAHGEFDPLYGTHGSIGIDYLEYDEDGSLALARALQQADTPTAPAPGTPPVQPLPAGDLNGSWYLQLTPQGPHELAEIRGPLRIEVSPPKLRVSGDIYVRRPSAGAGPIQILQPITDKPLLFGKRWYPQLPMGEYSWYFRSLGVTYQNGKLVFKFERRLWNRTTSEFINVGTNGQDAGFMQLDCIAGRMVNHPLLPQPTLQLTGTAQIGGETYTAVASKTSPFYRGCAVEVDVMTGRRFPLSATAADGSALSFESIYRTAGWDCAVTVDQTKLPDDSQLTSAELQAALTKNRRPKTNADAWRLWLLVGSGQGDQFGLMFDDVAPFREGTAGFFDARFNDSALLEPNVRNKKLGDVPAAFLRTLVHEAGHAFNLFHPKHDVHNVPIGTTIMNQTGDVMGFATAGNLYPGNVTFAFDEHSRSSLVHSPDPQVMPGWKRFGWGHGDFSSGIPEPVDALGLLRDTAEAEGMTLELVLPETIFRGEFVAARFVLTNRGTIPRRVTTAINLSQGDLRLLVTPPNAELGDVRDVILGCGDRAMTVLEPGQSLTGSGQIFYTNVGFTFRHTGRYIVSAELDLGDGSGDIARSQPVVVLVRAPRDGAEEEIARLALQPGVGRAFAFGDYGTDEQARSSLERLASDYGATDTGIAAAMVLANSSASGLRDLYSGEQSRPRAPEAADAHFGPAAEAAMEKDSDWLAHLAAAVCAPVAGGAPLLDMAEAWLRDRADRSDSGGGHADGLDMLGRVRQTLGRMR